MTTRLRFGALLSTFLVMCGLVLTATGGEPVRAYAPPTPPDDPEPTVDYVFEVAPGEDLAHWIAFGLDEADVPVGERGSRTVYSYENINAVWLHLTPAEASVFDELRGEPGVRATNRSWNLSVQWLQDDVVPAGTDGRVPAWPDQVTPAGVTRVDGGHERDYSDIQVGVIDTGVDRFHPDLNVGEGFDCTFEGHPDDWGIDGNGHGTHVSGTITALDNGSGVTGVAPGATVRPYKVLGASGSGSYAAVACGVDRAISDGVDVINMSLGGGNDQSAPGSWDSFHNLVAAADEAGIPVVVAAGNDTTDAALKSPANYPEAITVSAIATFGAERPGTNAPPFGCGDYPQLDNELAWFSNSGHLVDVAAPGVCVLSTLPTAYGGYGVGSGTSMASPHVAGVVAVGIACGYPDVLAYAADYNAQWGGDVDGIHEPLIVVPEGC